MGTNLAIILGSGIEIDPNRTSKIRIIDEDVNGVHKKVRYLCSFEGHDILVIQGRKHFYEGYSYDQLTKDIDIVVEYKVPNLIITNAAGGVNDNYYISDLMLISSYVNWNNSLIHKRVSFPYDLKLKELIRESCSDAKVRLHEGVYAYYQGPTYETKAEIRFQKKFNIDAAGMSTIPESNSASLRGIKVIALSVITNILKENALEPASHGSVIANAGAASLNLNGALSLLIPQLN